MIFFSSPLALAIISSASATRASAFPRSFREEAFIFTLSPGTSYDFGGVSGYTPEDNVEDHEAGLYEFKKRFGTEMLATIGEFDIVFNKFINKLFEMALKHR